MGRGGAHVDLRPARARVAKGKKSKKSRAQALRRAQAAREATLAAEVAAKRAAAIRSWAAEERRLAAQRRSSPRVPPPLRRVRFNASLQVTCIPVSHSNVLPTASFSPTRLRDGPPTNCNQSQWVVEEPFSAVNFSQEQESDDEEYAPIPERLAVESAQSSSQPGRRVMPPRRSREGAALIISEALRTNTQQAKKRGTRNNGLPINEKPKKIDVSVYTPPPRPKRGVLKSHSVVTPDNTHTIADSVIVSPEASDSSSCSPNSRSSRSKREKLLRRVRRLSADALVIGGGLPESDEKTDPQPKPSNTVSNQCGPTVCARYDEANNAETTSGVHSNQGIEPMQHAQQNGKGRDRKRKRPSSESSPQAKAEKENKTVIESGRVAKSGCLKKKRDSNVEPTPDVEGANELDKIFVELNKSKAKKRKSAGVESAAAARVAKAAESSNGGKQKSANGSKKRSESSLRFTEEGFRVYNYDDIAADQPSGLNGPCPFECSCCF